MPLLKVRLFEYEINNLKEIEKVLFTYGPVTQQTATSCSPVAGA